MMGSKKPNSDRFAIWILFLLLVGFTIAGCMQIPPAGGTLESQVDRGLAGPFLDEAAVLGSLEKISDHPLYVMYSSMSYEFSQTRSNEAWAAPALPAEKGWGCSLFAAMGDPGNKLFGRNFDWHFSPALLYFNSPPDKYASVSMVDFEYLGFDETESKRLESLPLSDRRRLLDAWLIPFDGMNEHGLVVGMAAVPPGRKEMDPGKPTVDSLGIIRQVLDRARTVEEGLELFSQYNIDFAGQTPLHYLLADAAGSTALVEFIHGEMVVTRRTPESTPGWQHATNFLAAEDPAQTGGRCWRYDFLDQGLTQVNGLLSDQEAMGLLQDVSQDNTQWSIVYGISDGAIQVVLDREYEKVYTFRFPAD